MHANSFTFNINQLTLSPLDFNFFTLRLIQRPVCLYTVVDLFIYGSEEFCMDSIFLSSRVVLVVLFTVILSINTFIMITYPCLMFFFL